MSTVANNEITLDVNGNFMLNWPSPRTGTNTFAKEVSITPISSVVKASFDGGASFVTINPSTSGIPYKMAGVIPNIYFQGTPAAKVEVSAQIAA